MGIYLNPGYTGFEEIRRDIYVDKSGLISFMNSLIGKPKPLVMRNAFLKQRFEEKAILLPAHLKLYMRNVLRF
ncbi:MAG: hypothetical protein LUF35_08505 [Lachnospiraceae bacterium]|nr:hypothetical protein [Lachnospiraceae bacterium]